MSIAFETLKTKQRELRDGFDDSLGLRVHRSISWLQRAEMADDDPDAAFIFFWIAFNAAYASELDNELFSGERLVFQDYFVRLINLDSDNRIYDVIWNRYAHEIRLLLGNRYVYQPFWKDQNSDPGYEDWADRFEGSKKVAGRAIKEKDTKLILSILFDRLYVLRNQLVHGGATWNSSVNRDQVNDGKKILASLVPLFIDIMMDHPDTEWGPPYYPVVD